MKIEKIEIVSTTSPYFSEDDVPYSLEVFEKVAYYVCQSAYQSKRPILVTVDIVLENKSTIRVTAVLEPESYTGLRGVCETVLRQYALRSKEEQKEWEPGTFEMLEQLRSVEWPDIKNTPTGIN